MKCINYRIKSKNKIRFEYCKVKKCKISYQDCKNCDSKEYKRYKPIPKRKYSLAKKEKERFSIIYPNLDKCCLCDAIIGLEKNEVFMGRNRQNSIKYGCVIALCEEHHREFHNTRNIQLYYMRMFQKEWENIYGSRDDFISIFKKNYL